MNESKQVQLQDAKHSQVHNPRQQLPLTPSNSRDIVLQFGTHWWAWSELRMTCLPKTIALGYRYGSVTDGTGSELDNSTFWVQQAYLWHLLDNELKINCNGRIEILDIFRTTIETLNPKICAFVGADQHCWSWMMVAEPQENEIVFTGFFLLLKPSWLCFVSHVSFPRPSVCSSREIRLVAFCLSQCLLSSLFSSWPQVTLNKK